MIPNDPDLALDDTEGTLTSAEAYPRVDFLCYLLRDRRDAPPVCDGDADVIAGDNHARPTEGYRYIDPTCDTDGSETA